MTVCKPSDEDERSVHGVPMSVRVSVPPTSRIPVGIVVDEPRAAATASASGAPNISAGAGAVSARGTNQPPLGKDTPRATTAPPAALCKAHRSPTRVSASLGPTRSADSYRALFEDEEIDGGTSKVDDESGYKKPPDKENRPFTPQPV